jgi:GntR family transcriptional regulator
VRQATELLVRQGLLERRRGAGTFVLEPRPEVDLFTLSGTLEAFERTGLTLENRLLLAPRLRLVVPDPEHSFGGRSAYSFVRLGRLGKTPVLLEALWLDPEVFPGLDRLPLAQNPLSRLVEEHYGRKPLGGRQRLCIAQAPARWARALGVTPETPLLLVRRWLDFAEAPSALFAKMYCVTDRVELRQTLSPDGAR